MSGFQRIAGRDEILPLGRKAIVIDDEIPALVLRAGDDYYCVEDVCTHDGQPLTQGPFDGRAITCPRHGAQFDVASGVPLCMPATQPVRTFEVQVRKDGIYVRGAD